MVETKKKKKHILGGDWGARREVERGGQVLGCQKSG